MKILHTFCFLLGALAAVSQAHAGTLYAATSAGAPGELYIINQATGAMVQGIGPLNDALSTNYPITGLGVQSGYGRSVWLDRQCWSRGRAISFD